MYLIAGVIHDVIQMITAHASYTDRQISTLIEESGELVAEGQHTSGTTRYRIELAKLGGAKIAPAKVAPGKTPQAGGQNGAAGGQALAPDPSTNHPESSRDAASGYVPDDRLSHITRALRAPRIGRRS